MAPPPTAGVSRKPSLFTCALRADDAHVDTSVHVHDGAPQSLEECARRVARDLRVKLLDAVVRGRTTQAKRAAVGADGDVEGEARAGLGDGSRASRRLDAGGGSRRRGSRLR
jgi:hypothetical protein